MLTHQTGQQTVPPGLTAQRCRPRGESARPTACSLAGPSKTLPRAHPGCPNTHALDTGLDCQTFAAQGSHERNRAVHCN
jgi:hypothetical protein